MNYTLSKNERLHSKKSIKELFDKGSSFFLYPFKVLYFESPQNSIETNQILFSVSKKKIKKAVDRNHVKRRIKEAYRLNKHLLTGKNKSIKNIAFIYVSSDISTFKSIEPVIQKILKKLDHLSSES
ncbi:ribonuclease P protein component [Belliella sp. R4-6]|uniref:Ribonuclease P protein component n=1 Tax=Belliella alkalica TaxID=1730871 RepID=A0ABS9VBM2_9BACT|nr:ribonuclease P protein component [Belliella alkalica]MCH7413273.1 ribonuclease P protein component [Belliella alkalica]